jgi:exodeoxyribonuclease V beta subunit
MSTDEKPPISPLDWQCLPLDRRVLIEASAGTGKTWTIGAIFLRLLLEQGLGVERILVTTFTVAAAGELRERLRGHLLEAEQRLDEIASGRPNAGVVEEGSVADWVTARFSELDQARAALRLARLARADLDRAPILTIHALCQRILRDFPFESRGGFGEPAITDAAVLLRECTEDFWRRRYLDGPVDPSEPGQLFAGGPGALLGDLAPLVEAGDAPIEAQGAAVVDALLADLATPANVAELERLADLPTAFAARKHALRDRLKGIAAILKGGEIDQEALATVVDYFTPGKIEDQLAPDDPEGLRVHPLLLQVCALRHPLCHRKDLVRGAVLAAAALDARDAVPQQARKRNLRTYAMLVDSVHQGLCGDDAAVTEAFAARLFEAFPAALIDEFQDTDRRQFAIFDRIYRDVAGNPRGSLVMIGDPKQAIYRFRGGDVYAYLAARDTCSEWYALDRNFRSSRALVEAVNGFYAAAGPAFGSLPIACNPLRAAGLADRQPWLVHGEPVPAPFILHRFRTENCGNTLGGMEALALEDCAGRIVAQLDDAQEIGGRPLGPGDIAVLVATNAQVAAMHRCLAARGVPCVSGGRAGNVFGSEAAGELVRVLHGVIHCTDERAVRAALATRLCGRRWDDFVAGPDREAALEHDLERFEAWHRLAQRRGLLAVISELIEWRGAELLAQADGERLLADLRHLGELVCEHQAAGQGLESAQAWLLEMQAGGDGGDPAADVQRLRLASAAQCVQLLTLHGAKGLEFPIVYLPLAWRIAERSGKHAPRVLQYHDADGRLRFDLGSRQFLEHRAQAFSEDYDERLRLWYVGLTRAVHAVHAYVAERKNTSGACPDWERAPLVELLRAIAGAPGEPLDEARLEATIAGLAGITVVGPCPAPAARFVAAPRPESAAAPPPPLPAVRPFRWMHSFSSLARRAAAVVEESGAADEADADFTPAPTDLSGSATADDPALLALADFQGTRFGSAVHGILEAAGADSVWPAQCSLVERQLRAHGIALEGAASPAPIERIARWLDRVRTGELASGLTLAGLAGDARVTEFSFQLPLEHAQLDTIRACCTAHGFADTVPEELAGPPLEGLLTGSIDLVFAHQGRYHVLDYKTNRLGERLADYGDAALDAAMRGHHYDLQALLYTVALHRYLGRRLRGYAPQHHLGESWYLFLRAFGLAPGVGVWRRDWPAGLIESVDAAFAGSLEVAA